MAGLNFQTNTIINDKNRFDKKTEDGKVVFGLKTDYKIDGVGEKNVIHIKEDFIFDKDKITSVYWKAGHDFDACKATVDFTNMGLVPKEGTNYCRLDVYVGVDGAEPAIYANPWAQKGLPFWVEFAVKKGDTAAKIAENVAKLLKKNHVFQVDKDLINVEHSDATIILTGATEYQRFKNIEVRLYDANDVYAEKVAEIGDKITLNEAGTNGFGTYSHIIKDLRLPTAANSSWLALRQDETPSVGALYNQFIVNYCDMAPNDGIQAVGERMDSHTTHVFWVKQDIADAFKKLFTDAGVTNIFETGKDNKPVEADSASVDPLEE